MPDPRYSPQLLEAFRSPRHAVPLPEGAGRVVEGRAGERSTGIEVYFSCRVKQGALESVAWRAYGSPYVLAGCELAARNLQGEEPAKLGAMTAKSLASRLSAPAERLGELLVIEDALRNCRQAWENRRL